MVVDNLTTNHPTLNSVSSTSFYLYINPTPAEHYFDNENNPGITLYYQPIFIYTRAHLRFKNVNL